ncbi:MAG TPA: carboxypeptidase regulatory-like domain-containing protein [Thermoplasmata archaeon]|nr:carboxypeptidase regulatory-like domain-containing protein [Thermoplasmata archaeon]
MIKNNWFKDKRGIEGLPMRLVIIVVIAGIVLAAIIAVIGEFKPKGNLSIGCISVDGQEGNLKTVNGLGEINISDFEVVVKVTDSKGNPVSGASVTITGANGAGSGKTGDDGKATIIVRGAKLNANENEEYMKATVSASGYNKHIEEEFIVIARVG